MTGARRANVAAVNRDVEVLIVEVKSCATEVRADRKWRDCAACCDRLFFAISEQTPAALMPLEAGLIVADLPWVRALQVGRPHPAGFGRHLVPEGEGVYGASAVSTNSTQ